jgi:hypothetical protein
MASSIDREAPTTRELRAAVAHGFEAGGGAPTPPAAIIDEITAVFASSRGRLFWTELERIRGLLHAFLQSAVADNQIECLRRARRAFLDSDLDVKTAARAPAHWPPSTTLGQLQEIVLSEAAQSAVGKASMTALRKMLQSVAALLEAAVADPFDHFAVFAELGLGEPSLGDVLEATALLASGVHPLEVMLFVSHRRPPAGDEVAFLLEVLAGVIEQRRPRIKKTYTVAELATGGDDLAFIRRAYRLILRKEVDDEGLSYYLHALQQGELSRGAVLAMLADAEEARSRGIRVV